MKAQDLREAQLIWGRLDAEGRGLVKDLASQIRATGLESTLRWLATKRAPNTVGAALCDALAIPLAPAQRGARSNLEVLEASRRAFALAEALHVVARAEME